MSQQQPAAEVTTTTSVTEKTGGDGAVLCRVVREEVVWEGQWLRMKHVIWSDPTGRERVWESLERTNHSKAPMDAVEIIAIVKRKEAPNTVLLVRQFRPAAGSYCIEFPAGLCDANEPPETTALRELKEETGYTGKVVDISHSLLFGMAVSSTSCAVATIHIDGDAEENKQPAQELDDGEYVEVLEAPVNGLLEYLKGWYDKGDTIIDGKIWSIAQTLAKPHLFLD
ncbi:nudix hydrolase-like protein [Balamuthia mandrillaris]